MAPFAMCAVSQKHLTKVTALRTTITQAARIVAKEAG
jgi:hypothetical protein